MQSQYQGIPNLTVTPHVPDEDEAPRKLSHDVSTPSIFNWRASVTPGMSASASASPSPSQTRTSVANSTQSLVSGLAPRSKRRSARSLGPRQSRRIPLWVSCPRCVVENQAFTALTTILTFYALVGDDVRLLATHEPADQVFDGLTITCLIVFTLEILLCTLGKDDYFLSFFFLLDVVSTITLVLDLTFVNDLMMGDEEDLSNVRGSRTAKVGARSTRLVRVIRLVRILKLYKAIYEANQAKKRREAIQARGINPGDEDDDFEDADAGTRVEGLQRESRVGKKLSELTIRRVIVLVLAMLLLNKILNIEVAQQLPPSASYGADLVNEAYMRLLESPSSEADRLSYERAMLEYIYFHNWYAAHASSCPHERYCPSMYDSQLFWVGIVSRSPVAVLEKAAAGEVRASTVTAFAQEIEAVQSTEDSSWIFNFGRMPAEVQSSLGRSWTQECNTRTNKYRRLGLSLIGELMENWEVTYPVKCPENLRRVERKKYFPTVLVNETLFETWHLAFYFDLRPFVRSESIFSLMITAYICFCLCVASLMFANDANRLVLYPVQNMIAKVECIRDNPLSAMRISDEEFKVEEMNRAKARKHGQSKMQVFKDMVMCNRPEARTELMETVILEKTIIKLGSLLALGFGQAGAQIIEHNMHGIDSACVDAMIEGTRVECIIGATRIRDFSTATEVLQSKVMTFVNQIAEIVHGVVDEFHGYASKNNGDLFLVIWRRTSGMDDRKASKLADMSMLAFTRILGAVHRSPILAAYRGHPGLQQRLGKNCRVNLSSGLHYGWAIEGAVGSEFKIDASYVSPNVSIAESIERATHIYGVSLLVAQSVVTICTPSVAAKCRLIDRVVITGSVTPMELYVIDLDYMSLTVEPPPNMQSSWTSRQRFRVRQFLEAEKVMKWRDEAQMVSLFNENTDISSMRFRFTLEFIHVFNMGYQNYSQGEWQVAQRLLSRTRTMLGVVDGPSLALLRFMETPYHFKAPEHWQGIRELGHASLQ